MTPVDQTLFHDPDGAVIGNCMQAAVASILDLPLDDVPHFAAADDWDHLFARWLHDRRMICLQVPILKLPDDMPVLLTGESPRGVSHMVVGLGIGIAHDPHPSRDGLKTIKHAWALVPYLPWEAT